MDFSSILKELEDSSSFDLYRLRSAIDIELENSKRVNEIKTKLKIGQKITYFDNQKNRLIPATVLKIKQTKILVAHIEDNEQWNIPYYFINIDNTNTDINSKRKTLTKQELKVGEEVGFAHKGKDIFGIIIRLNQKTVTLKTKDNHTWRVGYSHLFLIVDSDVIDVLMIEDIR